MKQERENLFAILLTVFVCIAIPISAFSADKLVIKDGEGTATFKVEDNGSVAIEATSSTVPLLVQTSLTGHLATFFRTSVGDAEIQIGRATADYEAAVIGFNSAGAYYYMSVFGLGSNRLVFNSKGYLGVGTTTPSNPLQMASGAYCTTGGVWNNASSRKYKTDIKQLTAEKALNTLTELKPVEFAYKVDKEEKHLGFIAEDAPALVATKDRKGMSSMDVVAVLTKVVQEQQKTVQEQKATIAELSRRLAVVEKRSKRNDS